jgi:hypothetical protein
MSSPVELTDHAISTNASQPIQDYSACFACHGATGDDTGPGDAEGVPDMVYPFHGLGVPYTGDDWLTGGNFEDHINQYAGPDQEGATQPARNTNIHPGPFNFNSLGTMTGPSLTVNIQGYTTTKNYGDSASGASPYTSKKPEFHKADAGQFNRSNATFYSSGHFEVPWDHYADAVVAPGSGSITIDVGNHFSNYVGSPALPLVPLNLP